MMTVNNVVEDEIARPEDGEEETEGQEWKVGYIYKDLTSKARVASTLQYIHTTYVQFRVDRSNSMFHFEQVLSCVTCISDRQKAVSCAHFYVNRLPNGVDKLLAAEGFLVLEEKWLREGAEDTETIVQAVGLMETLLFGLRAEDALRGAGAWTGEYAEMVKHGSVDDIVCKLFEDKSILKRSQEAGGRFPNLSEAADKIAAAASLDLGKIKLQLLSKWLPEKGASSRDNLDETLSNVRLLRPKVGTSSDTEEDDEDGINFLRCVHLAQNGNEDTFNHLVARGFSQDGSIR